MVVIAADHMVSVWHSELIEQTISRASTLSTSTARIDTGILDLPAAVGAENAAELILAACLAQASCR